MSPKYEEILLETALFHGFNKEAILTLLDCLQPKVNSFSKNDYIFTAGETFENVGIVLNGEVTVSKENAAGNRVVMAILEQGNIFGEMVAFSAQTTWPATVQAQKTCEIFFLPREKIIGECSKMCPWHRTLIQNFLKIISERALLLNKRVEYLTIKSMRAKISTYLLEQYKKTGEKSFTLHLKRNELADFLNVSRPSMSREIAKMKDEGIIDFYLSSFKILDIEALKSMSNL